MPDTDTDQDDKKPVRERLIEAISSILQEEGEFTTKFVCLIESIGDDGACGLWALGSDSINSWDALGMLQWGIQHEQTEKIFQRFQEDE